MMVLTEINNGSTINVAKDDRIEIRLAWNPSTGFFWQATDTTAGVLEQIKHDPQDEPVKPGQITYVGMKFRITNSGVINLCYARPWSETEPCAKWFSIEINVVEAPAAIV